MIPHKRHQLFLLALYTLVYPLFAYGQEVARQKGLILVDTKYEFGLDDEGNILLIDECHTPDSSRYWLADSYQERIAQGEEPENFDKEFLQQKLLVRSMRGNLFSFNQHWAFLAEDPSLEMSLMPAFMEDNSVANDTIMIPGSFDIGKYFRTLDYAFHVKDHAIGRPIQWSRSDVFCYVKFHTHEPIKLKRFFWTAELEQLDYTMMQQKSSRYDTPNSLAVEWYYKIFDKFNMKERMIEIIQKNLTFMF